MSEKYGLDPVSAIREAEARGETAEIFADIRETMELPLVTSIWRTLVAVPGGLPAVWLATKPLYETGQPAALLRQMCREVHWPVAEPLAPGQLASLGVSPDDLPEILAVLAAYNRSNGLNLITLTGLVDPPSGAALSLPPPTALSAWPKLPPLLAEADMAADTWELIHDINRFGTDNSAPDLATLWRHLAHWPGLLKLIYAGFLPLHQDGTIQSSIGLALKFSQVAGGGIAQLRQRPVAIPMGARGMIESYVRDPGKVARMVAMGHGIASWLGVDGERKLDS